MTKEELREIVRRNALQIKDLMNAALAGENHAREYQAILARLGRGGRPPHWYEALCQQGTLPNLDGKTIGSVVEMLMVAVVETHLLRGLDCPPLRINPARGVDLPDLDLGVKSPSTNWCTSEPFFSAYERLIGSEHDAVVLLTNYQEVKSRPPLRLQILSVDYLKASEIADFTLCNVARGFRAEMRGALGENFDFRFGQLCQFLAYINQSDWRAKNLLSIVSKIHCENSVQMAIRFARRDFELKNQVAERKGKPPISDIEINALESIAQTTPIAVGVLDATAQWLMEAIREASRVPSAAELRKMVDGPLDGRIGMSFALQWRYNFQRVFPDVARGQ